MAEQLSGHGEHVYYIVMDTGNARQCVVQCHSPHTFDNWQAGVRNDIATDGFYLAKVKMMDGKERTTMVVPRGACTLAFMTREDVDNAKRMAQMAQLNQGGGLITAR